MEVHLLSVVAHFLKSVINFSEVTVFNANFALIKVTKFYRYYIIVIVLPSEGRVTILISKSSNYNIIEYTVSEFCGGGGRNYYVLCHL